MTVKVRRLEPEDDRSTFRSGDPDLDRFFIRYAGQNQFRHHIGTTYIAVDDSDQIVGFATVAASEIRPEGLTATQRKNLPRYPVPVLRLARLAVDERAQRTGVGQTLLRAVLALAEQLARTVGCLGVLVDAKPQAIAFYERLGFIRVKPTGGTLGDRPEPTPMFLELGQLEAGE